jgi:predicted transport protein
LLLELANASSASAGKLTPGAKGMRPTKVTKAIQKAPAAARTTDNDKALGKYLASMPEPLAVLLASLDDYMLSLGDDVQRRELKLYIAFKRLKNFATIVPQRGRLLLYLHLDVDHVPPPPGIGRDVWQQGHWGTGDMELSLTGAADLEAVKPLIQMAYEGRSGSAGKAEASAG